MAFRCLTRGIFQLAMHRRFQSARFQPIRLFSLTQSNRNAYQDLNEFLKKEIQLEKTAQLYPKQLPKIEGFQIQNQGPEVTLTRQSDNDKIKVTFNVINSVNTVDSDDSIEQDQASSSTPQPGQLKSRPTFTVDINRGGQTLSFICSYLPSDYSDLTPQEQADNGKQLSEGFQIDEFAIHDGEWTEKVYSSDCSVIDGELYDKLLDVLEEQGIGEGKNSKKKICVMR